MNFRKQIYFTKLFVLCLGFSSCMLFQPSASKLTKRALKEHAYYDAIIVPGVPFIGPTWDLTMQMRVVWAVHLYKKGLAKNIIMSGGSVYSPYVEGQIMKLYAVSLGVPEENIFIESRAQHSTENVWYSYKMAKLMGFETVALSTDPFQTSMVYRFGKRRLKEMRYLPVIYDTLKTIPKINPQIQYETYKVEAFTPITDTQSFWYRLGGTMGKHIDFEEK